MAEKKNLKIIFTNLKPDIWQYKVASTLKDKQVKTTSISLLSFNRKLFEKAFDEIICLDLPNLKPKTIFLTFIKNPLKFFKFFHKIFNIKADAAIVQGPPLYLTSFFIKLFKGKFPRIFFSYDILSAVYQNPKEGMTKEQIWGEKYSFKNCDAILNKGSSEEIKLLPKSFGVDKKPIIEFSGYPLSEWFVNYKLKKKLSYKDKEIHIVYPATILPSNQSNFIFFPIVREILKQKIHMHIYPIDKMNKKDLAKITLNKKELENYLHIHKYVSPNKLSEEISKYDFGLFFCEFGKDVRLKWKKYTFAMKCSSYIESSIPVIMQNDWDFLNKNVSKNYLGIILPNVRNLRISINKFDYLKSVKNIKKFREKTSVEKNINRLIEFVENLKLKNK